jgi:hypothetical protein
MFSYASSIRQKQTSQPFQCNYYSVEIPLRANQPLYQFKLWQSEHNSFFLLAKNGSDLVSQLKVGHIVSMKYYSENAMRASEIHDTRIMEIVNETVGRFRGHCRIELDIVGNDHANKPKAEDNGKSKTEGI